MVARESENKNKGEKAMALRKWMMDQLIGERAAGHITDEYFDAAINERDTWVAACGGKEEWTPSRSGRMYLYVWNPATGEHGWLNQSDIVETESPYGV